MSKYQVFAWLAFMVVFAVMFYGAEKSLNPGFRIFGSRRVKRVKVSKYVKVNYYR